MRTRIPLLLAAFIALSGCVTPDKAMKSMLGQHSSELIARWGPPHERGADGSGGQVWTWYEQRQWTTPGQATTTAYGTANTHGNLYSNPYGATYSGNTYLQGTAHTTYTPPQTHGYRAHRTFFIDSSGTVYRYGWRGL